MIPFFCGLTRGTGRNTSEGRWKRTRAMENRLDFLVRNELARRKRGGGKRGNAKVKSITCENLFPNEGRGGEEAEGGKRGRRRIEVSRKRRQSKLA